MRYALYAPQMKLAIPSSRSCVSWLLIIALLCQTIFHPATLAVNIPATQPAVNAPQLSTVEAAVVRRAPVLNGHVEGSLRQLTGENVTLNSGAVVTGDLLVPGTPTVRRNGNPNFGGTVVGTGSAQPSGYTVTLNSGSTLGHLVTRTDPISLADVAAPPASQGTRSVTLNSPTQSPGDFNTLRDLTLNSNAGNVAVPPGTYRNFTSNGRSFIFGVVGATQPAIYNLNQLTLNSGSQVQVVGPIVLTLGSPLTLNGATMGASNDPLWLTLKMSGAALTLNSGSALYGIVRAPYATATINGATLQGSLHCNRLTVNSGGLLSGLPFNAGTLASVSPAHAMQGQSLTVTLTGQNTHWVAGQMQASFGGEVSVGGAPAGALGPVTVINETTALADIVVSATAALAPRNVRVVTPITGGGSEDLSLNDGFVVVAVTPPGAASTNVTTVAGGEAGFADGPAAQARFRDLAGIAIGSDDAIYVADAGNHRIRLVSQQPDGSRVVQTLAGDGTASYRDGAGAQARFNNPQGVAVDASGVVYVADTGNHRIRRIALDGMVTTVAGDGTSGYQNGAGAQARFNSPRGVALDNQGNLYVADTGNSAVRLISSSGVVQTVAGDGTAGMNDSPNARFNGLAGIAVDGTSVVVYLADTNNHRIRRLDSSGTVITLTGAERGYADGSASDARFAEPSGLAIDGLNRIVVADTVNSLVRVVAPDLIISGSSSAVTTVAGTGERGLVNGTGNISRFTTPRGVAVSLSSAIIVADTGNHVLRRIGMPPIITSISPSPARVNTPVSIYGEGFDGRAPVGNLVKFARDGGGQTVAQVTAASRTQLNVIVPADAATGPVTVTTADGTATSPMNFEVAQNPAPVISDFTPRRGPVGTNVKLIGTALQANAATPEVMFAGPDNTRLPALVNSASATEVQVTVPNGAVTGRISLSTEWGQTSTDADFIIDETQDFQLTAIPATATAIQGGQASYIIYVTSQQDGFTQLARLSATGLPAGVTATFTPSRITAGDKSTLSLNLTNGNLSPGSYSISLSAAADIDGHEVVRTANVTLNVVLGGQTTLSGRVLSTDNEPIMGATASLDGHSATTDAAGSFLLSGVTAGVDRPLMVDGRTASAPNRTYPVIIEPANIVQGEANVVPYTFFLPPIDAQYEVDVVPGLTSIATNPRVEGLVMTIPANAHLRNRDNSPVARVSITPVPIDRTPAPLPSDIATAMVYTSQPGGAITDVPIPVVYPNLSAIDAGTQVPLYAFNHDTVQWYIYGYGRVSDDGRTIAPEIDPNTGQSYGLPDFSWHFPGAGPGGNPGGGSGGGGGKGGKGGGRGGGGGDGDCDDNSTGGNPVDYSTGIKFEIATDISFGSTRGRLELTRTYTSDLAQFCDDCPFGRGGTHNYAIRLSGNFGVGGSGRIVMPAEGTGRLFSYARTDPDGSRVFTTRETTAQLADVLRRLSNGTFEYKYADGEVMRFNSDGRLTAMVDRSDNVTTLNYSGSNLTSITDSVGRSITLAYDSQERIASATDPLGRTWQYTYEGTPGVAGTPGLTTVTDPTNKVTRYTYSIGGRLATIIDPRGATVKRVTYDDNGRVIRQQFADGGIERYVYSLSGTLVTGVTITDALGRVTSKRFNASGYVLSSTDALGQTVSFERNITTNLPTGTSGTCNCTEATRQYDARGNVIAETNRQGTTVNIEYNASHNQVTKFTDSFGNTTTLVYDSRGNLTSMTNALNQTTTSVFNSFGQLTSVTDPLGHISRMEYDADGNMSASIDQTGHRLTLEYDAVGRRTAMVDALGRRTSITYDNLDRILTSTDAAGAVTRFEYDSNGNTTKVTDALGRVWRATYDLVNRPISATDPLGRTMKWVYNVGGEVVSSTSPQGRVMTFTYDPRGELLTATDPLGGVLRYTYDTKGNLLSLKDKRGNTTSYTYDALFRPTGRRNALGQTNSVVYDAMGQVKESIDQLGRRRTYTYDVIGRKTSVTFADAQVTYTYDNANRMTGLNDTQSGQMSWTHDDAARVLSETTAAGTVNYTYNDAGQRASMTVPNRPPVTYTYDTAGRLQAINQGVEEFSYAYDLMSRMAGLSRPNSVTTSYSYDVAGRLERLRHTNGLNQAIEDYQYTYTADDQIASITSLAPATQPSTPKTAATADAANRVAQLGNATYSFDDKGQITAKTDAQGTTQYKWDARGRMTQATLQNGQAVNYDYDAVGRLSKRSTNGSATSYLYDGLDVVQDQNSDGSKVDYINGGWIDDKLEQSGDNGSLYYLTDHLGSTTALTDQSGGVVNQQSYDAFGAGSGSALTRYGYTGRERDGLTGLYHYRARWYDPQQGRFISEDPIGFEGGLNFYSYAGNNPLSFIDPMGLSITTFLKGLATGAAEGFFWALVFSALFAVISCVTAGTALAVIVPALTIYMAVEAAVAIAEEIAALLMDDMCPDERHYRIGYLIGSVLGALAGGTAGNKLKICFVAGTKVQTKDGEKAIEDIRPGDFVLASDPESGTPPQWQEVVQTFARTAPDVVDIDVGGQTISCTPEHPFWVIGQGWTAAGELRRGNALLTQDGIVVYVDAVERRIGAFKVYNFEVANLHTYYVSSLGLLVHNSCGPKGTPKPYNPEQNALIQLAKEANRKGGVTPNEANILRDWANETGLPFRGPEAHPGRGFGSNPHIHLGPINHIPVK